MKKLFFTLLLLFTSKLAVAQEVKRIRLEIFETNLKDKESYRKRELPALPCTQLYAFLNSYIHQKDKRTSAKAIQALADLYSAAQQGDTCREVRVQITKDYLTFIQTDSISSSRYGLMEIAISELGESLSIEILKQVGGRDIILSLLRKKGRRGTIASSFIIPLQLKEIVPEIWGDFDKSPINNNDNGVKYYLLDFLFKLDRVKSFEVYKKTIWNYAQDTSKIIHQQYFYDLLNNIRYLKDQELAGELFKILEYLSVNPKKDKKIYITTFSDTDQPTYWFLGETIFYNIIPPSIANLPEKFYKYPYPKYNKENIKQLLDWYRQHPNIVFK